MADFWGFLYAQMVRGCGIGESGGKVRFFWPPFVGSGVWGFRKAFGHKDAFPNVFLLALLKPVAFTTMNSHGATRRISKRRRTAKALPQLLDLNSLPVAGPSEGSSPSSSMPVSHSQASSSMPPPADGPHVGMHSFPIDVEAFDDDVVIYPSRSLPQTRQRSTRMERITVIIDDDSETTPEPPGDALDEHVSTLLSLGINRRHELPRVPINCPVISLLDTPEVSVVRPSVIQAPLEPVKEVPKEPKFTCPVCMNELTEASSTICGHIFCQKCIKASIQAQKKCPTCRKKLSNSSYHRVYLPTTE
ncbi:hypothetical protein ACP70R_038883 [Stipagrostis hirtigluma subsp. patula]